MTQEGRKGVHKDVQVSIKMYFTIFNFYLYIRFLALKSSMQNYFKIILSLACKILSPNPSVSF